MNEKEFEAINGIKNIMHENGLQGVQFMRFKNDIVVFETFGNTNNEYISYTVDLYDYLTNGELVFIEVNVLVEEYEELQEFDVTINTHTYDENMKKIDYNCETVKTYKRENNAIKRGLAISENLVGSNFEKVVGVE